MVINGLNNFQNIDYYFNAANNRSKFDMIYPELQILGEYKSNCSIDIGGFPVKMAGRGLLNMKVVDFRYVGEFEMGPNPNLAGGIQITDVDVHFYVGDVIYNNWDDMTDIAINNFANKWMREFTLLMIQEIQPKMHKLYEAQMANLNMLLADGTEAQLINMLEEQIALLNKVQCNK